MTKFLQSYSIDKYIRHSQMHYSNTSYSFLCWQSSVSSIIRLLVFSILSASWIFVFSIRFLRHTFACYFIVILLHLQGLVEHINISMNKKKDEDSSLAELTRKDIIKCIRSDKIRFRGVNLSGLNLSKLVRPMSLLL